MVQSVLDLKKAGSWSIADYVNTMTGGGKYKLQLDRESSYSGDPNRPAHVILPGSGNVITMVVFDALFNTTRETSLVNLVHEQAHVWDFASGGAMSSNLMAETGSYYDASGNYHAVGGAASGYHPNELEDWAETVTGAVYPTHDRFVDSKGKSLMGQSRKNHIKAFLPKARLFNKNCSSCPAPK